MCFKMNFCLTWVHFAISTPLPESVGSFIIRTIFVATWKMPPPPSSRTPIWQGKSNSKLLPSNQTKFVANALFGACTYLVCFSRVFYCCCCFSFFFVHTNYSHTHCKSHFLNYTKHSRSKHHTVDRENKIKAHFETHWTFISSHVYFAVIILFAKARAFSSHTCPFTCIFYDLYCLSCGVKSEKIPSFCHKCPIESTVMDGVKWTKVERKIGDWNIIFLTV